MDLAAGKSDESAIRTTGVCDATHYMRCKMYGDVLEELNPLFLKHGKPEYLCSDTGYEFITRDLQARLEKFGIQPDPICPNSP